MSDIYYPSAKYQRVPARPSNQALFDLQSAPYTCPELKRNPGIPDDRFEAFKKPSRHNDTYTYPKGNYDD